MYHMDRNGRSNFYISTVNAARSSQWEHLFGTAVLPALSDRPRFQELAGNGTKLAYDLDLGALNPWARLRLAAHVARRTGRRYADVLADVSQASSWPIAGDDVYVVDTAVSDEERPFLLWRGMMNRLWVTHNGA